VHGLLYWPDGACIRRASGAQEDGTGPVKVRTMLFDALTKCAVTVCIRCARKMVTDESQVCTDDGDGVHGVHG
jgi:hypothetical protein